MENNIIYEKCLRFSHQLITTTNNISNNNKILINQMIRSGTSIGAWVSEAQSAESLFDFVHKLKIADKEAHETEYWLKLMENEFPGIISPLLHDLIEIKKLLSSIIVTCRKKRHFKNKF